MKSVVDNKSKHNDIKYPCLMRHMLSPLIVLFVENGVGTVVFENKCFHLGEYRNDWTSYLFEPFHSSVILSNE